MSELGALQVRTLTAAAAAYLEAAQPLLNGYWRDGVPDTPPSDGDGRAHEYWVLYAAPGTPTQDNLARVLNGLIWQFQVTCVGGDVERAADCLDSVRSSLTGARIPVEGGLVGRCSEIGNSGSVTEDRDARPSRWFSALIFNLHVTRSPNA